MWPSDQFKNNIKNFIEWVSIIDTVAYNMQQCKPCCHWTLQSDGVVFSEVMNHPNSYGNPMDEFKFDSRQKKQHSYEFTLPNIMFDGGDILMSECF